MGFGPCCVEAFRCAVCNDVAVQNFAFSACMRLKGHAEKPAPCTITAPQKLRKMGSGKR
jgi:hypothetical protein